MEKYDKMSMEEKSRWMALMLAVDEIDKFCDEQNISFDNLELKPIAIKHYINEMSPSILKDMKMEATNDQKTIVKKILTCGVCDAVDA